MMGKENNRENSSSPGAVARQPRSYLSPTISSLDKPKRKQAQRTPASPNQTPVTPVHKRLPLEGVQGGRSLCRAFEAAETNALSKQIRQMVESVLALFKKNEAIQARWWSLSTVVDACQRLSNLDRSTALVADTYCLQFSMDKVLEGLLHPSFNDVVDAVLLGVRSKKIYIHQIGTETAIYADFSRSVPRLPRAAVVNASEWMKRLSATQLSLKPYMSLELYSMINFWYSTEVKKLFGAREGETAKDAAQHLQALLRNAAKSTEHAKELIHGLGKSDPETYFVDNYDGEPIEMHFDDLSVEKLAAEINMRASYLLRAITLALETDAEKQSLQFGEKRKQAMAEIQTVTGDRSITNPTTIHTWLRQLRVHRRFPNPLMKERIALFDNHPKAAVAIREYGNKDIQHLSLEIMGDFVRGTLIPQLAAEQKVTTEKFLKANELEDLGYNTIHRWLRFLGLGCKGSVETERAKQTELRFVTIQAARKMYKLHSGIAIFNRDANKIPFTSSGSIAYWMEKEKNKKYIR
ncbi:expressed unknown protein [Seminavis robusta]|uniref:Uncharacterized protein n=1 Tax=Seminavis robusta TaxID=568900 RepID=A0A9N8E1J9_9STRA|nr:expressed unknown protein [Seminavis robusta]|eukprot:Sro527_g160740.1 n/a (522) ;mRNA; f:47638-49239